MIRADVLPNTPEWLRWRRTGVGGSDVPILLGVSSYADASVYNLAVEKLGLVEIPETMDEMPYAMRRGIYLEPKARRILEESVKAPIYSVCGEREDFPHHKASLDGLWSVRRSTRIAEFKALKHEIHLQFERVSDGHAEPSSLPVGLLVQCQWQLYVSGAEWCYLCNYSEKKGEERQFHRVKLYPEPDLWHDVLIPVVDKFWRGLESVRNLAGDGMGWEEAIREVYPEKETAGVDG
jgi:putative phage-type endonuclease